jgi:hypothetical protein
MELNWTWIAVMVSGAVALLGFLVYKNFKDEDEFEHGLDEQQEAEHKPHVSKTTKEDKI